MTGLAGSPRSRLLSYERARRLYEDAVASAFEKGWEGFTSVGSHRPDPSLSDAARLYEGAMATCLEEGAYRDFAVASSQLGMLHHFRGRLIDAMGAFETAQEVAESLPVADLSQQDLLSTCLYHLGILSAQLGQTQRGRRQLERSMEIDALSGNSRGEFVTAKAIEWLDAQETGHA